jgi:hypothetical protein
MVKIPGIIKPYRPNERYSEFILQEMISIIIPMRRINVSDPRQLGAEKRYLENRSICTELWVLSGLSFVI